VNTLHRRSCKNPDGCPGWVDVADAHPHSDEGARRACDTCGGWHEVRFRDAPGGRFTVTRVEWSPEKA
jgi:hypothetical protein